MKDITFKQLEDIINDTPFEPQSCNDLVWSVERAISKVLKESGITTEAGFICTADRKNVVVKFYKGNSDLRELSALTIKVNKTVFEKGNGSTDWRTRTETLYNFSRIIVEVGGDIPLNITSFQEYRNFVLQARDEEEAAQKAKRKKFLAFLEEKEISLKDFGEMAHFYSLNKQALQEA